MATKYILAVLAILFFVLASSKFGSGKARSQGRTWLIIAVLFAIVSGWLFYRGS